MPESAMPDFWTSVKKLERWNEFRHNLPSADLKKVSWDLLIKSMHDKKKFFLQNSLQSDQFEDLCKHIKHYLCWMYQREFQWFRYETFITSDEYSVQHEMITNKMK